MEKECYNLEESVKFCVNKFLEISKDKEIQIISHFDTDGITSAAIMIKTLKRLDKIFSLKIVKTLTKETVLDLPKDKVTLFLDLASNSFNHILEAELKNVFIIDHHEITQKVPENINIINPELDCSQKMSASCLVYLFSREISSKNKDCAKLAILGMIGDMLEKEIDKLNNNILNESEIKRKRGLLIYPSTRPINRTLEYCSNPYIPGVTGDMKGVLELLRNSGIKPENGKYKNLIDLNQEEMTNLVTSIMLKNPQAKSREIIGDIFLIKLFNSVEDARELSAKINACSRLGETDLALQFCLEIQSIKGKADSVHAKYKQLIISGLKFANETEKIQGKGFVIINAKNRIKDTMTGTIASILSSSKIYEEGTIVTTLAYYDDKIKVSARGVGRNGRNVREIIAKVAEIVGGECGGHRFAAGATISQEKEKEFIDNLRKNLEIEIVKI